MEKKRNFSNESFHYIYSWWDPRDGKPIYVGKGTQRPDQKEFFRAYRTNRGNIFLTRAINKIECLGLTVQVEVHPGKYFNETEVLAEEKRLIKKIGRRDLGLGPLLNLTDGGEGLCGAIITEEHRLKISRSLSTSEHRTRIAKQFK